MATGIFAGCVFYLDVDARLGGPASLSGEQKSQDFADTSASDFAVLAEEEGVSSDLRLGMLERVWRGIKVSDAVRLCTGPPTVWNRRV